MNIITITFNPCIDKSTIVPQLVPEKKLLCEAPGFEPGGGGINVARAIKKLGGEAMAIYPCGGYSGAFLNELLKRENIPTRPVETKSHTRENMIVLEKTSGQQFRFGMPGPVLQSNEWQQCLNYAEEIMESGYLIVSGSMPAGIPENIIVLLSAATRKSGTKLVVDTTRQHLKLALEAGVFMIKPNLGELASLVGKEVNTENAACMAKELLSKYPVNMIVVSMGAAGAILVSKDLTMQFIPPEVKRLSTVGAGDSMLAGIIYKLTKQWPVKEAVRYGVACGTAATLNPGTELCHAGDAEEIFQNVQQINLQSKIMG